MVTLSQSEYLSHNSQNARLLFSVGLSMKTSKPRVHIRSSALHSYCVMRTALTDQFLLLGLVMDILTNSAKAKRCCSQRIRISEASLYLSHLPDFRIPHSYCIDFTQLPTEMSEESVTSSVNMPPFSLHRMSKMFITQIHRRIPCLLCLCCYLTLSKYMCLKLHLANYSFLKRIDCKHIY